MIYNFYKIYLFLLLVIIASCDTSFTPTPVNNTYLSVDMNLSASQISLGEQLIVSIDVQNADSLYAMSLVFNYANSMFEIDSITYGNLFENPLILQPDAASAELSISTQPGDLDSIQETASGTACIIYLTSTVVGVDVFYISSIHMIKSNGEFIDEFDMLSISTKESEVIR
tara:strand:- start:1491 stop:2003 length:513 start_codon:yes stop_codon:yes gene_type:complete